MTLRPGFLIIDALPEGEWRMAQFGGNVVLVDRTGRNPVRMVTKHGTEEIKVTATPEQPYFVTVPRRDD